MSSLTAQEAPHDLSGEWIFTVVTVNGTGTPDVTLDQDEGNLTGIYSSPRLGTRQLRGTVEGDTISFRLAEDPSAGVTMTFVGTVQDDGTLEGTVDLGGMGDATFTARRRVPQTTPVRSSALHEFDS